MKGLTKKELAEVKREVAKASAGIVRLKIVPYRGARVLVPVTGQKPKPA